MVSKIQENFADIASKISENINYSVGNNEVEFNKMMVKLDYLQTSASCINSSSNPVLHEVYNDLFNSSVFMAQGFYRNAHMCLRSSIELILNFLYFTDRNYDYLLWKNNKKDASWSIISSTEGGVFDPNYLSLFATIDNLGNLKEDVKNCYRYCSEYVHGKFEYMQTMRSNKIEYNQQYFVDCYNQFMTVADCVNLLLIIRFNKEARLIENNEDQKTYGEDLLKKYGVKLL